MRLKLQSWPSPYNVIDSVQGQRSLRSWSDRYTALWLLLVNRLTRIACCGNARVDV